MNNQIIKQKKQLAQKTDKWMSRNRSLVLRQTPIWAQSLAAIVICLGGIGLAGGFLFRVDEIISVTGQLESTEGDTEVKTPVGGKISKVFVQNGQEVKKGQPLMEFDTRTAKAEILNYKNLIELEKNSLDNKLEIISKQQEVLSRKFKTNEAILSGLEELVKAGGIGRNEYLIKLDGLYELESQSTNIGLERRRLTMEANKAISNYKSELKKAELQVQYQIVNSPANGIIFDMKITENGVINAGKKLLTIIPQNGLKAKVNIGNSEIGSIEKGQKARIRVDAYPFTKYGEIMGVISEVGADALPPDEKINNYRYPVEISLEKDTLDGVNKTVRLKNGMAISANIKLRDKRLIALISDLLVEEGESVKKIRQQ
jgi:HlyD family secretion protein